MAAGGSSGGEEHWIDRRQIVILGVHRHQQNQKDKVSDRGEAPGPGFAGKGEPREAADPERSSPRKEHVALLQQKRERRQLDVLVGVGDVFEQAHR
jgi:hypothetical protein